MFYQMRNIINSYYVPPPPPSPIRLQNYIATPTNPNPTIPIQYCNGKSLLTSYSVPTVLPQTGKRQTSIAIIVAYTYPNLLSDLKKYWQNLTNFGPNSQPPVVNIKTMPGATMNSGWAMEECLDVQMVCTINPNANIWVVEAKSDSLTDLFAALTYAITTIKADVISMSWGGNDSPSISNTITNSYFNDSTKCFCASSGDANTVSFPAVSANCLAVGGTTLLSTPGQRTEITWVNAGSGYSTTVSIPSYQTGINNTQKRCIPDISAVAGSSSPVYIFYNGSWMGVSGTSVSAPIVASILSIANQQRINQGKPTLTTVANAPNNIQNYLYKTILTNPTKYSADFNDITIGNNTAGGNTAIYNTGSGFDVATGIGSPNVSAFCADLVNI
jgi:subtilase family serine protease